MAKKLIKRNTKKESDKPTKPIEEVKIGDEVIVNGLQFKVYQIDDLPNKFCLVDKYACDYYAKKGDKVELVK